MANVVNKEELKRVLEGVVVSDKMNKTIVVETERTYMHPQYRKILRKSKRYKVHDEDNTAKVGDRVKFVQCRPLAKTKYMNLLEIVKN